MNIGTDRQRNKATDDDTEEDDNCFVCAAMNIQVNFELLMFKLFYCMIPCLGHISVVNIFLVTGRIPDCQ